MNLAVEEEENEEAQEEEEKDEPYPVLCSAFIGLVTTSEDLRNLGIQCISWDCFIKYYVV
ncbi:hypothetical protein AAC387_Pa06g1569 [Persea americana]